MMGLRRVANKSDIPRFVRCPECGDEWIPRSSQADAVEYFCSYCETRIFCATMPTSAYETNLWLQSACLASDPYAWGRVSLRIQEEGQAVLLQAIDPTKDEVHNWNTMLKLAKFFPRSVDLMMRRTPMLAQVLESISTKGGDEKALKMFQQTLNMFRAMEEIEGGEEGDPWDDP